MTSTGADHRPTDQTAELTLTPVVDLQESGKGYGIGFLVLIGVVSIRGLSSLNKVLEIDVEKKIESGIRS